MGTDSLGSQSKNNKEKDRSKGETRNSTLGTKDGSPTPNDTATAFQSDQQYPATAGEAVTREHVAATETPAEEVEGKRAEKSRDKRTER